MALLPGSGEFELYHLVRADPRVIAADEAQRDFRNSPEGRRARIAEIEGTLASLDPATRDRYDAHAWNTCATRNQVRGEILGKDA